MSPHLNKGEYIIIEKFDHNYQRDDVIVFKTKGGAYLIKRIIGLPTEKVLVENGQLKINDIAFQDSYIATPIQGNTSFSLGVDEYFVLSDNAAPSLDSRTFGPVKFYAIVGKVLPK